MKKQGSLRDAMQSAEVSLPRHEIISLLGEGGMASVYLACPTGGLSSNKLLVIKRLRSELARDPAGRAMFLNEGRLAARLNHRNVVQLYEVIEADGEYYLTMEYLDGQPYSEVLRRLAASRHAGALAAKLHIAMDTLAGLHYAHELTDYDGAPLGIVHRDVSPQNIFVTYDGLVKVVDFGIAKATEMASATDSGIFKGKVGYSPPEQLHGAVDRRADIFGAGVVLWEALAGERFWGNLPSGAILNLVANGKFRRLEQVAPHIPAELIAIVNRATAYDRADRFATADEMRGALDAYVRDQHILLTAHDLGRLVEQHFQDERATMRRRVEAHMMNIRGTSSAVCSVAPPPTSRPTSSRAPPRSNEWDITGERRVRSTGSTNSGIRPPRLVPSIPATLGSAPDITNLPTTPPPARRRRTRRLATAAAFVMGAVGVTFGALSLRPPKSESVVLAPAALGNVAPMNSGGGGAGRVSEIDEAQDRPQDKRPSSAPATAGSRTPAAPSPTDGLGRTPPMPASSAPPPTEGAGTTTRRPATVKNPPAKTSGEPARLKPSRGGQDTLDFDTESPYQR